jgi:hypothetical protein
VASGSKLKSVWMFRHMVSILAGDEIEEERPVAVRDVPPREIGPRLRGSLAAGLTPDVY